LSRAFGWLPYQIDEIEIEDYFDYLIVAELTTEDNSEQPILYADQVAGW